MNVLKFVNILFVTFLWRREASGADLNCTINNLTHNYLIITDPVYDTDDFTEVPYTYTLQAQNVSEARPYYYAGLNSENKIIITVSKINEKAVKSQFEYHYSFTITLICKDRSAVEMYTTVPLVDTNTYAPFFNKPTYVYNLISMNEEDFNRLYNLDPIIATDYDVTNTELIFSIKDNSYFDIVYDRTVPGSLNKRHYAKLIPKNSNAQITEQINVDITVTDMGNPPKTDLSRIIINPPSPPKPVFADPYYVGHLYKNRTFVMNKQPQLEQGTTFYQTNFKCLYRDYYYDIASYCQVSLENGKIVLNYLYPDDTRFYSNNYLAIPVKATYTDEKTKLSSSGTTVFIVEFHHNL